MRTENAMTQEHAFKAAELCVRAQMQAARIGSGEKRGESLRTAGWRHKE